MKWLTKLFRKEPVVEVTKLIPIQSTVPSPLRKGTWVCVDGRVGILTDFHSPMMEVTFTKADGSTVMILEDETVVPHREQYHKDHVVRAPIADIPVNRYESVDQLRTLGYGDY